MKFEEIEMSLNDNAFKEYREKRMQEMLNHIQEITTEKELIAKTQHERMIVHFYKDSFKRCGIMDKLLKIITKDFTDIKFYRISADLCPVVTKKLEIATLPFLAFFKDGFFVDQVVGFEDVGGDNITTVQLKKKIINSNINKPLTDI